MCCKAGGKTYRGPGIQNDTISPYMPVVVSLCAVLGVPRCVQFPMGGGFKGLEMAIEEGACSNNPQLVLQKCTREARGPAQPEWKKSLGK
jgi:hypothetical protein